MIPNLSRDLAARSRAALPVATGQKDQRTVNTKPPTPNVTHFLEGRDLAVEMLRAAERLGPTGDASIEVRLRNLPQQNLFVVEYLKRIQQRPRLMDGFAAVLSDLLAGPRLDAAGYAQLSLHDMVGVPGRSAT